jgi:hypothetical protein
MITFAAAANKNILFKIQIIMKRKWIRRILGGLGFTSVLFTFQACYGTPQDFELDLYIEGLVRSEKTGLPLKGIIVSVDNGTFYDETDEEGRFGFYTLSNDSLLVNVIDADSTLNGSYLNKDTVISVKSSNVYLDIKLAEK